MENLQFNPEESFKVMHLPWQSNCLPCSFVKKKKKIKSINGMKLLCEMQAGKETRWKGVGVQSERCRDPGFRLLCH